jgi:predicted nucleic acid-binding protein
VAGFFLVDNSAYSRQVRFEQVRGAINRYRNEGIECTCLSTRLEILHSTRDGRSYESVAELLNQYYYLPINENVEAEALHIQRRLWLEHKPRAANPIDVLIAAIAVEHDATVLHYDQDFEFIAQVEPYFSQQAVAEFGSLA